ASGIDHPELAERLGIDLTRARRIVEKLRKRGLVEREENGIRLTAAGREALMLLIPEIRAALDRVMAPLSDSQRETLKDLLTRVIRANEVGTEIGGGDDPAVG